MIAAFAIYGGQHCAVHGAETGCVAGAGGKDGVGGGVLFMQRTTLIVSARARRHSRAQPSLRVTICASGHVP